MDIVLQVLLDGFMWGAVYALIASGLTMVYAITRLLNFAHGDLMFLTMYICLALYRAFDLDPYLSILIITPLMVILGLLIFHFLIRPLLKAHILMVIQLTLGLVFIISNSLVIVFTSDEVTVPTFITASKLYLGPVILRTSLLVAFGVSTLASLGFYWVLRSTDFGRSVRAISQNSETAELMGINVGRVQMIVFTLGIMLLGIVGPLVIPVIQVMVPTMGLHMTLFAFIILVVGGAGNFLGALIGGLINGIAEAFGYFYLSASLAPAIPYAIFVLILLFRPQGLIGEAA